MKFLKLVTGLLLLPFCIGFAAGFAGTVFTAAKGGLNFYILGAGFALYLVIHILFKKPLFSYVFSHELTHGLWALVFGGKISAFYASEGGGKVDVSKSNFLIALSPYFFPLYAIVVLVIYLLVNISSGLDPRINYALMAMIGFFLSYHVVFTFRFLNFNQPDLKQEGRIFSYIFIATLNFIILALMLKFLFPARVMFAGFLEKSIFLSLIVYKKVIMYIIIWLRKFF